jgi:hypothetical protein
MIAKTHALSLAWLTLPVFCGCAADDRRGETADAGSLAAAGGLGGGSAATGGGSTGGRSGTGGSGATGGASGSSSGAAGVGGTTATGGTASAGTTQSSGAGAGIAGKAGDGAAGVETGGAGKAGSGAAGAGGGTVMAGTCETLPSVSDYAAPGPFADAKMFTGTGPSNNYTLFRPDTSLGMAGFKHPIVTWGNGISTTPNMYESTLTFLATHGFVIIACNDTQAERPCLSAGLDWLISENASGSMAGKLDVTRELAIGYSWGGGAAIDTSDRPNIKATVSLHGMPPRETDAFPSMHAPLLLFTSTGDTFVSAAEYVTPNYEQSTVQTFYATLADATAGHLYIADEGASVCLGAIIGLGACGNALVERAPTVAWLRYWGCNDQNAKSFFFGDDCVLCKSPWTNPQRKEWN